MSYSKRNVNFKTQSDEVDMFFIKPTLLMILAYTSQFCLEENLDCIVTDMISSKADDIRKGIKRKSTTHADSRAFDLSVMGWSKEQLKKYENNINMRFDKVGALVYDKYQNLLSRPVVFHNSGYGDHFHLQVRK